MAERRRFPARGLSMLPSIYPRDVLHVEAVDPARLRVGDLVAYVGTGQVACHRVMAIELRDGTRWFELRGDAQLGTEWVPAGALLYAVIRVEGRLGAWRADGPRGRLLRRLALSPGPLARTLRITAARGLRAYAQLRAVVKRG